MTSRFSSWIKQHPVISYFLLAYVVTWVGVLPLVLSTQSLLAIQISPNFHIIAAFGPILSAFIVTAIIGAKRMSQM